MQVAKDKLNEQIYILSTYSAETQKLQTANVSNLKQFHFFSLDKETLTFPRNQQWIAVQKQILNYRIGQLPKIRQSSVDACFKWVFIRNSIQNEHIHKNQNSDPLINTKKSISYYQSLMLQAAVEWQRPIIEIDNTLNEQDMIKQIRNKCSDKQQINIDKNKQKIHKQQYKQLKQSQKYIQKQLYILNNKYIIQKYTNSQNIKHILVINQLMKRNGQFPQLFLTKQYHLIHPQYLQSQIHIQLTSNIKSIQSILISSPLITFFLNQQIIPSQFAQQSINISICISQIFKLYFIFQYYTSLLNIHINKITAYLDTSGHIILHTIKFQFNKQSALSDIYSYLYKNPFIKQQIYSWEIYPYQLSSHLFLQSNHFIPKSYRQIIHQLSHISTKSRQIIAQLCLSNGKPSLLNNQPLQITLQQAINQISLFDDILIHQLTELQSDRSIVRALAKKYYILQEGNIKDVNDLQDILSNSVRRIFLEYPKHLELMKIIPKERAVIKLAIKQGQVSVVDQLIHIKKILGSIQQFQSICLSIQGDISTPQMKKQIRQLILYIPSNYYRVIIKTNITTIDHIQFLWNLGITPIVSQSLFKQSNFISKIISVLPDYNSQGIINCVVTCTSGIIKGQAIMNKQSMIQTVKTRQLHVIGFERDIYKKPVNLGDKIIKISLLCSHDNILIVVQNNHTFCKKFNRKSCFRNQSIIKTNLSVINDHIKGKIHSNSYSGFMQTNPGLALAKIMQQFWQIICATNAQQYINQCSDFLVHFLMYINGQGINLDQIINQLNSRAFSPQLVPKFCKTIKDPSIIVLGILSQKYYKSTDNFILSQLGIKIIRPTIPRKLLIQSQVVDQVKYRSFFKDKKVSFLPIKSKDMPWLIAFGAIDGCITYSPVMDNYPIVSQCIYSKPTSGLKISLIKRRNDIIDPTLWTKNNKAIIACQHVNYIHKFFVNQGISDTAFTLNRIVGSSQSYLITKTKVHFCLCDAVVQTGLTLQANDLEVWKDVIEDGNISIGLYLSLKTKI